jgi:hypothetical protein
MGLFKRIGTKIKQDAHNDQACDNKNNSLRLTMQQNFY